MRTAWTLGASAILLSQGLFPLLAHAATFPDVSSGSPYAVAISALADMKVINGNPDGTFAPDRTVNRAEFLTMLYRAKAMTTSTPSAPCFTDVPTSAWFAPVICDAATKTYVSGYKDGSFKPQQAVNRVEALKMLFTVHGLSQQGSPEATASALAYPDLTASAWYMQYVSAAFRLHILPVPGVSATLFGPDQPLSRAEAAAYIYNAIFPSPLPVNGVSSSAASAATTSSAITQASSATSTRSAKSEAAAAQPVLKKISVPFSEEGMFVTKLARSYTFSVSAKTTVSVQVSVSNGNVADDVTCRLYKIESGDSFSLEYYLGYQSADSCVIKSMLAAGSYQLDIAPRAINIPFTVNIKSTTGDGNDGFVEAKSLVLSMPVSTVLDAADYGDYFTFKLKEQTNMMIELTNEDKLRCIVYPMQDVDIYGFATPECNTQYDFPAGTYYIGVLQKDGRAAKQSYSIRYKK